MKGKFQDGPPSPNAPKGKFVYEEQGTAPVAAENQLASVLSVATQKSSQVEPLRQSDSTDIEVGYARAITGNDVTVACTAAKGKTLARVEVEFDGQVIGDDSVSGQKYHRHFQMQGSASPGMLHKLEVKVTDSRGEVETYEDAWTDLN